MNYERFTNEELQRFPYPNLISEWRESGYSICTLAEHMGIGLYRSEDDPETLGKLRGAEKITVSEAAGLCRLFGVEMDYLFSKELRVISDMPVAYWRWYDENKKRKVMYSIPAEVNNLLLELLEKMNGLNEIEIQEVRTVWIEELKERGNKRAVEIANIVCDAAVELSKHVA